MIGGTTALLVLRTGLERLDLSSISGVVEPAGRHVPGGEANYFKGAVVCFGDVKALHAVFCCVARLRSEVAPIAKDGKSCGRSGKHPVDGRHVHDAISRLVGPARRHPSTSV